MDRMNQELARIRHAERMARAARRPIDHELHDYRAGNGLMRIIRLGRR
jgi:hypothetical protein